MSLPLPEHTGRGELERALMAKASQLAPWTLLRLLQRFWPERRVRFVSRSSAAPEPHPVDGVSFTDDQVTVTLNIGLRSSTSPLPSYFRDLETDPSLGPPVGQLLDHIDQGLLPARVEASDSASSPWLLRGQDRLPATLLRIACLPTQAGLFWLFSRIFPELLVSLRRGMFGERLVADNAILGAALVGSAMLGGALMARAPGFEVVLRKVPDLTWTETDFGHEATRRLTRWAWPALAETEVWLRVWLVDKAPGSPLRLGEGRVGVEPLTTPAIPDVRLLFEGRPPKAVPSLGAPS